MTKEIKTALAHVRKLHPEVSIVIFNKEGQWQYMDDNFTSPKFGNEIDTDILQDASDSTPTLPYIYQI